MQSTVKRINPFTIELNIKESSKEFEKFKEKALTEISENANIKWFRKGAKIPAEIIVKNYWEGFIENQAIDLLMNEVYGKALKKEWIVPTWPANIKELKSSSPFEIILEVEVLPEIEIDEKKLKNIKIKKTEIKIGSEEVNDAIKEIEKKFSKFEELEWSVADLWDKIMIDTQWFEKKWEAAIPETKVSAFPLVLWSWSFIPGFEDKLIWTKVWDVVEFEITFPEDYHSPDFAWRVVFFMTTVFSIEKAVKPEWTEEFIEQLRWVKTDFEWFKKILEDEIRQEIERNARLKDEEQLLIELTKISTIEVWEHLLAHEIDRIYKEQESNIESKWMNMWHYLEHIKKDITSYKEEVIKPEAEKRLKAELILSKLKDYVKVELSEEELNSEIEKILSQYQNLEVLARLREKLVPWENYYEDIKARLNYKKIVDTFFE